jgi:hypothetical protein
MEKSQVSQIAGTGRVPQTSPYAAIGSEPRNLPHARSIRASAEGVLIGIRHELRRLLAFTASDERKICSRKSKQRNQCQRNSATFRPVQRQTNNNVAGSASPYHTEYLEFME